MSINSLNKTYDPCQEPVCATDPVVRILGYPENVCIGSIIFINWTVDFIDEEPLTITAHRIKWSVNTQNFDMETSGGIAATDEGEEDYYEGAIETLGISSGIIYFKVEVQINNKWIGNEEGILVITLADCSILLTCPRVIEENPDGSWSKSLAYVEYTTWWVPDQIAVRSNLDENGEVAADCEGVILWDSTCTATLNYPRCFNPVGVLIAEDEIKGLKDGVCYNPFPFGPQKKSWGIYADCFEVNDYDLPLKVETIPNCCETNFTHWVAYVEGVDFNVCTIGLNNGSCIEIPEIPTSSASSSSSSSRSSSSSSSRSSSSSSSRSSSSSSSLSSSSSSSLSSSSSSSLSSSSSSSLSSSSSSLSSSSSSGSYWLYLVTSYGTAPCDPLDITSSHYYCALADAGDPGCCGSFFTSWDYMGSCSVPSPVEMCF
jgi:hypothetical protein